MKLHHALCLARETCALRHLSLNTEKTYLHWIGRYASFLRQNRDESLSPERKMEAFLTRLALTGMSGGTQNQAFNALLFFYRDVLKKELGPVDSLPWFAYLRRCWLKAPPTGTVSKPPSVRLCR